MERKEEKRYTTGEFAKYFGIKKDTLFYYDEIKLFCPAGIESNGYRYYTSSQINTLWTLLSLREVGVSIKDLQEYFSSPSPQRLHEIAETRINKIDEDIFNLRNIKRLLTDISDLTKEALQADLEQLKITELPDKRFIYSKKNVGDNDTSKNQWDDIYEDFVLESGIKGTAYVGSVISCEDLLKGKYAHVCKLFTESKGSRGNVRKGGMYAVFYHKGSYDSINIVYPDIIREISRLGYKIAGDAYEEYLINELSTINEDEFVTKIVINVA